MSSQSNFLFSPANHPTTDTAYSHPAHTSQISHADQDQGQTPVTKNHNPPLLHHLDTSSPSSSRDSNHNPFSFSSSSSSSQSLQSSMSWQTENTSFGNSNSPTESSKGQMGSGGQRDVNTEQHAASRSNISRPTSSNGNVSTHVNNVDLAGRGGGPDHQHHQEAPNLTFTHTFPRFDHSHDGYKQLSDRRASHNLIHSSNHVLNQNNGNPHHRLSYDSAMTFNPHHNYSNQNYNLNHPASSYHQQHLPQSSSNPYQSSQFIDHSSSNNVKPSQQQQQHSFQPYIRPNQNQERYPSYSQTDYKHAHQAPPALASAAPTRPKVTTTLWEDEGTLCYQVDSKGVCVARRHDNNMINGTKLLNVVTEMTRGKRDTILKMEKSRVVVKSGSMHLKGVWIAFEKAKQLAEANKIIHGLYPLFEDDISTFLYTPENYVRTNAVMAAAKKRNEPDQSKAEMEQQAAVRTPTSEAVRARKESLDGQISELTAPRAALATLGASRPQGRDYYSGGSNLKSPADLSQPRSCSYSGASSMGPPSNSNSQVPTPQFSFHVPYSTQPPEIRSRSATSHEQHSQPHSPSQEISSNSHPSGLASRPLPLRQSSFDRRHSMPVRSGESEDHGSFSQSLPRFAEGSFANTIGGTGGSGGVTPSLSPLNIMSPSHSSSPFGMIMPPNAYTSPSLPQQSQSHQQQQFSNLSSDPQQQKYQQQSKHQSYFMSHPNSNSNSGANPFSQSSSPSSSRAASISSPGDFRHPAPSSRSVSREQYLGSQNQLPHFSNDTWAQDYPQQPATASPSLAYQGQHQSSDQLASGRSHSLSQPSPNHRSSIFHGPPLQAHLSAENSAGSNSMRSSPASLASSTGLKRSRASLTDDGQQYLGGLNMSASNSSDSNPSIHGSQDLSSASSDLADLSHHSTSNFNFDGANLRGTHGNDGRQSHDEDEGSREMKRSKSGPGGVSSLNDLAAATFLEG